MAIVIIKGPSKSLKSTIAAALRNNQISNGKGALLIDDFQEGELKHQLEKIIVGVPFPEGSPPPPHRSWLEQTKKYRTKLKEDGTPEKDDQGQDVFEEYSETLLPFKPDSMVIVVDAKEAVLDEFEKMLPGFKKQFGPVYHVNTNASGEANVGASSQSAAAPGQMKKTQAQQGQK
jgi:hypothetical protein